MDYAVSLGLKREDLVPGGYLYELGRSLREDDLPGTRKRSKKKKIK